MATATSYRSFAEQALHYFTRPHTEIPCAPVVSPADWRGPQLAERPQDWQVHLDTADCDELYDAVETLQEKDLAMDAVTAAEFPLPTLGSRIAQWRRKIMRGRGFVVLRGLPVAHWGEEVSALAYWGMGHHLGVPGAQNPENELLGHVRDYGEEADNPAVRRYRTTGNIAFHCDAADAVGLLCLRAAKSGGQSRIASSVAIFNEIMRRRPDLIPLLFEPFKLDRRGEQGAGDPPYVEIPPCCFANGELRTFYHSDYFRSVTRHPEAPPLTTEERAILDLYDELAASPEFHLDMWLEPGDIQLLSNHTIIHARTAYEDHDAPPRKRHLLRLWLSLPAGS